MHIESRMVIPREQQVNDLLADNPFLQQYLQEPGPEQPGDHRHKGTKPSPDKQTRFDVVPVFRNMYTVSCPCSCTGLTPLQDLQFCRSVMTSFNP
jgi:hypothetical protein